MSFLIAHRSSHTHVQVAVVTWLWKGRILQTKKRYSEVVQVDWEEVFLFNLYIKLFGGRRVGDDFNTLGKTEWNPYAANTVWLSWAFEAKVSATNLFGLVFHNCFANVNMTIMFEPFQDRFYIIISKYLSSFNDLALFHLICRFSLFKHNILKIWRNNLPR